VAGQRSTRNWLLLFLWFLGSGTSLLAQFETRSAFPVGTDIPIATVSGDFNRDGKLDLAVVEFLPKGVVAILLGNGDGTFRAGPQYEVGVQPQYLAAADFRQNGTLDLVVSDTLSDNIFVMLGNGDGTFQAPIAYATSGYSTAVSTGDFTGDGKLDIIALTGSVQCICVSVFPGNGDGTFQPAVTTPVPYNTDAIALGIGRFTADSNLDIAVTGEFGGVHQVDILLGNGDGTFRDGGYYGVGSSPNSIAVADFNHDTRPDLAIGNYLDGSVSVLIGNGDGTFQQAVDYPVSAPSSLLAKDLNGDGNVDLAVADFERPPGVSVLKGKGDGTFAKAVFYSAGSQPGIEISAVGTGDFNKDNLPDLVAVDYGFAGIITILNTGVVSFSPTTPLNFKTQKHGTTSRPLSVKLTNTGTAELKMSSMKASSQFAMKSSCGPGVAPGASCTISVTFSPTSTGAKSGTATINDSASSKPMVIELSGTGT
jgi:hypothetical protein